MSDLSDTARALLADFPVHFIQTVAWGEMDAFQHVNNVVYFRYFESARIAYGREIGMMDWMQTDHVGPIISSSSIRYKRPVVFPDTLIVGTRITRMSTDRFWQQYRIVSTAQQAVCTEGEAEIVMFSYATHKKAAIPELLKQRLLKIENGRIALDSPDAPYAALQKDSQS